MPENKSIDTYCSTPGCLQRCPHTATECVQGTGTTVIAGRAAQMRAAERIAASTEATYSVAQELREYVALFERGDAEPHDAIPLMTKAAGKLERILEACSAAKEWAEGNSGTTLGAMMSVKNVEAIIYCD